MNAATLQRIRRSVRRASLFLKLPPKPRKVR